MSSECQGHLIIRQWKKKKVSKKNIVSEQTTINCQVFVKWH